MNQRILIVGSKRGSGGPTNLINKSEATVVINEDLVGVMIRFICENPRSASLEEIEIVLRAILVAA